MRAASERRTRSGRPIGLAERVAPDRALELYLGDRGAPGGPARRVELGAAADLCLLRAPLAEVLAEPGAEQVAATVIAGEIAFARA
jgi:hypothetical protein